MFAAGYLLATFFCFIFEKHDSTWITPVERPLAKLCGSKYVSAIIAGCGVAAGIVVVVSQIKGGGTLSYGLFGVTLSMITTVITGRFNTKNQMYVGPRAVTIETRKGYAAAGILVYLELQYIGAAFSSTAGAFGVTNQIYVIMAGLAFGMLLSRARIRTMYCYTPKTTPYLLHGTRYAAGAMGGLLITSLFCEVSGLIIGLTGVAFIFASLIGSKRTKSPQIPATTPATP